MPDQGDIVLIPIPFTDLSSKRRRPVIVISNNSYNQKTDDMLVIAMTSNSQAVDYSFTITSADLTQGSLNRPGKVRSVPWLCLLPGGGCYIKTVGSVTHSSRALCSASARDVFQQLTTVPVPPPDQKFPAPYGGCSVSPLGLVALEVPVLSPLRQSGSDSRATPGQ